MTARPPSRDLGLLALAVCSIAFAAVLTRWAEAPALALAFWRTAAGSVLLAPAALRSRRRIAKRHLPFLAIAGLALAVHFGAWLESIERTSIAASVTLVSVSPVFVTLYWWLVGRTGVDQTLKLPTSRTWLALAITIGGAAALTGADALSDIGRLDGNLLALLGAVAVAVYLLAGDHVRSDLPTSTYASPTYAIAALSLLVVALATDTQLTGFNTNTWLAIGAMVVGPQLCGHTVLNALLPRLGSITVSLAYLAEPIAASFLGWLLLSEAPPAAAWLGGPLVVLGLGLQIISRAENSSS